MPTARPRHSVTETDELATALDDAAARWPELSRAQILVRLALEGSQASEHRREERRRRRLAALRRNSGVLTGAYGHDYLADLRQEWRE